MSAEIQIMEFNDYQKRPVTIRATKLDEAVWDRMYENAPTMSIRGHKLSIANADEDCRKQFIVHTLEGNMIAELNDMLIIGVQGEIYPCKPDIFEQTYDKV